MLNQQISRLAKVLVDSEGIDFAEAEARLLTLTLEIVVGKNATSPAAHAAVLTAASVARRTFIGGVRVVGETDQVLNSAIPIEGPTLAAAVERLGVTGFEGKALQRIIIGLPSIGEDKSAITAWWDGWRAGAGRAGAVKFGAGDNPLAGIAAAGLSVGAAFQAVRGAKFDLRSEIDLWVSETKPAFGDVLLPGAVWLFGLGNLGQAYLWALAALPYANPKSVELVLQDRDKTSPENWATSVLVPDENFGIWKTKIGEAFCEARGFDVRRVDRFLMAGDRLEATDPRMALCGMDKIEARRLLADVGFDCIVDAGLGRTAAQFARFRVSVFDGQHPIDRHFADMKDEKPLVPSVAMDVYRNLEAKVGACGAAEIAGASAAVPFVSAVVGAIAVSRLIKLASGQAVLSSEVGNATRLSERRSSTEILFESRGVRHGGQPRTN